MTPLLIAVVLGTGLLALLPTRRLARRTSDGRLVTLYLVGLWLALAAVAGPPGLRRFTIPLALAVAVLPWIRLPSGLGRFLRRAPRGRRPPRNVTPPEAGGPYRP